MSVFPVSDVMTLLFMDLENKGVKSQRTGTNSNWFDLISLVCAMYNTIVGEPHVLFCLLLT